VTALLVASAVLLYLALGVLLVRACASERDGRFVRGVLALAWTVLAFSLACAAMVQLAGWLAGGRRE
jgi:hypothetical protein